MKEIVASKLCPACREVVDVLEHTESAHGIEVRRRFYAPHQVTTIDFGRIECIGSNTEVQ